MELKLLETLTKELEELKLREYKLSQLGIVDRQLQNLIKIKNSQIQYQLEQRGLKYLNLGPDLILVWDPSG